MTYFITLVLIVCSSERVGKTNVTGILLSEAKYINLSLHYLEQVRMGLAQMFAKPHKFHHPIVTCVSIHMLFSAFNGRNWQSEEARIDIASTLLVLNIFGKEGVTVSYLCTKYHP